MTVDCPRVERGEATDEVLRSVRFPDRNNEHEAPIAAANLRGRRMAAAVLDRAFPSLRLPWAAQATDATTLTVGSCDESLMAALDPATLLDRILRGNAFVPDVHIKLVREREPRTLEGVLVPGPGDRGVINSGGLVEALREGYTAVFDGIELRDRTSVRLTEMFERVFGCQVNVNGYLSIHDPPSFGAHWDDQEVVILQLLGHKHWSVEEPVALSMDKSIHGPETSGRVVWSQKLSPGSAVYIPRGWGHLVNGLDELTFHYTITIPRLNGLRLLDDILWDAETRWTDTSGLPIPCVAEECVPERPPAELFETEEIRRAVARHLARLPRRPTASLWHELTMRDAVDEATVRCTTAGGWMVVPDDDAHHSDRLLVIGGGQLLRVPLQLVEDFAALTDGNCHTASSDRNDIVPQLLELGVLEGVQSPHEWGLTTSPSDAADR